MNGGYQSLSKAINQTTQRWIMLKEDLSGFVPVPARAEGNLPPFRLIAHCIAWGLFLVLLAFVVPRVEAIFLDFGIPLPRPTLLVIGASHWVMWALTPVVAIPALLLLLGADWLMLNARSGRAQAGLLQAWSVLMLASPLLLIALTLVGLVLPLLTIMTRLNG
jgi:hypothetical protein